MIRVVAGRIGLLVAGLLLASVLVFVAMRIAPGDVAQVVAGTDGSPERLAAIRAELGLDRPLVVQYLDWLGGLLRGDLGASLVTGTPVADELAAKAEVTVPLAALSLVVALAIAVPGGIAAALLRRGPVGPAISVLAQLLAAAPVVWAGMLLVLLFSQTLGWLPPQGFPRSGWEDPGLALRSLVLPALAVGVVEGAVLLRFLRSAVLEATGEGHVRAAAARGMTRTAAVIRRGLPAIGLSVVSVLGLQVAGLLVGAVLVEQLFTLPGIGRMLVADIGTRDVVKVQSVVVVLTAAVLAIGAAVDLVHRLVDPRLRVRA